MRRLFVSDLHLADPDDARFRALTMLLQRTAAEEVYVLGDLCEVWIGDDDDGPLARRLVDVLASVAERARVFVMHGNRDFLFAEGFERATGATLLADPWPVDDGRILLSHGDAFCIDDAAYQDARRLLRSPDWQADVLARPLEERRLLARQMREQSRATNANKADNIMDVAPAEIARVVASHGAEVLIHGHTHRPGVHLHGWGRRYVLGAWERCGWLLQQTGAAFALRCFPLAQPPPT